MTDIISRAYYKIRHVLECDQIPNKSCFFGFRILMDGQVFRLSTSLSSPFQGAQKVTLLKGSASQLNKLV